MEILMYSEEHDELIVLDGNHGLRCESGIYRTSVSVEYYLAAGYQLVGTL